ncbi:MAG: fumarate reductase subunit D [Dehalococcoidia bacterium]|nr:fumarate reductase subunit D [Dehalococcoidia bacterium]
MRRSNEPLFWSLFSAGGVVTALLVPALILVTGFLVPAERVEFGRLEAILSHPVGRLALFGVASLTFIHAAHRLRHVLVDMGLRRFRGPIAVAAYLAAIGGAAWAATVAFA